MKTILTLALLLSAQNLFAQDATSLAPPMEPGPTIPIGGVFCPGPADAPFITSELSGLPGEAGALILTLDAGDDELRTYTLHVVKMDDDNAGAVLYSFDKDGNRLDIRAKSISGSALQTVKIWSAYPAINGEFECSIRLGL